MKSHTKTFLAIYYIRYVTLKDLSYTASNNVNLLYVIMNNINVYIEESNETII